MAPPPIERGCSPSALWGSKGRSLRRLAPSLLAGALFVGFTGGVGSASARTSYHLELPPEGLDAGATARAVEIELREIDVPGHPERPDETPNDVHLFVRVGSTGDGFVVELWDRGEAVGSRRVTATGQPTIIARRIALAVVELTRQLKVSRERARKALERARELAESEELERLERARRERTRLVSGVSVLALPDIAWFVGPSLGVEWNRELPLRLRLEASYRAGELLGAVGSAPLSLAELRLSASHVFESATGFELETGAFGAAGVVLSSSSVALDGISGQHQAGAARVGFELGGTYSFSPEARLRAAVDVGLLAREVQTQHAGEERALRGGFVGASLAFTWAPPL